MALLNDIDKGFQHFDSNVNCGAYFQTQHTQPIEIAFSTLSSFIQEVVLNFDEDGITFKELNSLTTVFIVGKFGKNGNTYKFKGEKGTSFQVSLKIKVLVDFLKFIKNNHQSFLTFIYDVNNSEKFHMEISNLERTELKRISAMTLDTGTRDELDLDSQTHWSTLNMDSQTLQSDLKGLGGFGDAVVFQIKDDKFSISVDGDRGNMEVIYRNETRTIESMESDNAEDIQIAEYANTIISNSSAVKFDDVNTFIRERFPVKDLICITKATPIEKTVEIRLGRNMLLILTYDIPKLGFIKFAIAPLAPDEDEDDHYVKYDEENPSKRRKTIN
jgi:hypothetical protein